MRKQVLSFIVVFACGAGFACTEDPGNSGDAAAANAGSDNSSTAGSTAGGDSTPGAGGSTGGGVADGGEGGHSAATSEGACGLRGEGSVTEDSFEGFIEYYLVSEENTNEGLLDEFICAVRFEVSRVGEAPDSCGEFAGQQDECLWAHLVEIGNAELVTDERGVCASSDLGLDADAISGIEGTRTAYGFASEYQGHNSVLMKYDEATDSWGPSGNASWDPESGELEFRDAGGFCSY